VQGLHHIEEQLTYVLRAIRYFKKVNFGEVRYTASLTGARPSG